MDDALGVGAGDDGVDLRRAVKLHHQDAGGLVGGPGRQLDGPVGALTGQRQ